MAIGAATKTNITISTALFLSTGFSNLYKAIARKILTIWRVRAVTILRRYNVCNKIKSYISMLYFS
jgi:hypothetical protein